MKALLIGLAIGVILLVIATAFPSTMTPYLALAGAVIAGGAALALAKRIEEEL
jgi:small basic protein